MNLFDEISKENRTQCQRISADKSADIYGRALSESERNGRLSASEIGLLPVQDKPFPHCILPIYHPARALVSAANTDIWRTFSDHAAIDCDDGGVQWYQQSGSEGQGE